MCVTTNGRPVARRILNDALFCHASPAATSRYIVELGGVVEEHKSSGFWIGPAAGSTAAQRSAGGKIMPLTAQELQLVVSPYDVRQGMFSGGGINAITRSGTNELRGSTFYVFRDQSMVGNGIDDRPIATFSDKQFGGTVGGPIARNRAFFLGNVEWGRKRTPSGFSIDGSSGVPFGHQAEAARIRDIAISRYGFDPGGFDEFLDGNDLRAFALACDDDLEIMRRFVAAPRFIAAAVAHLTEVLELIREPLAVRSSSLLEDSQFHPFAGIYQTYMLPGGDLDELLVAIKRVYASTFYRAAREYIKVTSLRVEDEKMGVIVQRMVGSPHGPRFYPEVSGVARS
jgi:hypothetical protein